MPRGLPVGVVDGMAGDDIVINLYANYVRTRLVRIINYEFPAIGRRRRRRIDNATGSGWAGAGGRVRHGLSR